MDNLNWKYVKELKNIDVFNMFEEKTKVKLPEDIKKCFGKFNGGRPDKKTFDTDKTKEMVLKSLLSFNDDDRETVTDAIEVVNNEKIILFPLASDPGGNYICYSVHDKNIILFNHEDESNEFIAENFSSFLESLY